MANDWAHVRSADLKRVSVRIISMNILMTSSGGIIRDIESWPEYGIARGLVKKGHDVTVISSSTIIKKHTAEKEETIEGINVRRFNPIWPSSLFYMLKNDYDIIHSHHFGYLAPISSYAIIRKKIKCIPIIFTVHGLYHDPYIVENVDSPFSNKVCYNVQTTFPYTRPWRIFNWFTHLPLQADRIIALTEWEKNELKMLGIDKNKIDVIPNGINIDKYAKYEKGGFFEKRNISGNILLFVGQPTKRKGWDCFLKAIPHILKEFVNTKAVFIGYRRSSEMEEMCKKLGITDSVVFLGFLPEKEKIEAFKSADVFVFPTLYEGFGIVFLEAMASGLPIVTTDVAGNCEIVLNKKNGLLVKPNDPAAVANAVVRILRDRKLSATIRRNNIKMAPKYDWNEAVKKYINLYEDVLG